MVLSRILREPLVHFLAIGAGLFLLFRVTDASSGKASSRILVTPGQIERLSAGFARTWQRPPTDDQVKQLVDEFVREEIAYREAMAMGLDRDDPIVRRRLRQKIELVWEEAGQTAAPTEGELAKWLSDHAASYRVEPQVAFRQVFVDAARRGSHAKADAEKLLARLKAGAREAGDAIMVPEEIGPVARTEVARLFGDAFADRVVGLQAGQWAGPIESGYGLHLVLVTKKVEGRLPELSEVRPAVERDLIAERRHEQLEATYRRLLEKYPVTIEKAPPKTPKPPKPPKP